MSAADREKWNQKYQDPDFAPRKPSPVLVSLAEWLPTTGRCLDIAGGCGRHAIWLAQRGLTVTIADISAVGLKIARERAAATGVELQTLEIDLAGGSLGQPWRGDRSAAEVVHDNPSPR